MALPLWLAPLGLGFDIVGVLILALDAADTFPNTVKAMENVGKRSGGMNAELIRKTKKAGRLWTWLGLGFVLFGFTLQFFVALDAASEPTKKTAHPSGAEAARQP